MSVNYGLAPYASFAAQSLGRLYKTSDSPTRTEFQRDRDRILHSSAFRRLKHKTQVFLHHEGDHYRTRLTHTLEVSQIARSIARALQIDEDLSEALALAHDLGHPPFGHAGERVLNRKMHSCGGFDHNAQALRVVTLLENRYAEHDGLNLTWETLEGIVKHNGPLTDATGKPSGRYAGRALPFGLDRYLAAADLRLDNFAGLEAQAAAIADDIAYNAHDIDDALRAGLLTVSQLREVSMTREIVDDVLTRYPEASPGRQAHEVVRRLLTGTIEDVIAHSRARIAALAPQQAEDVRRAGETMIAFSSDIADKEKELKGFLLEKVYRSESVLEPVERAENLVAKLFDAYLDGVNMPDEWEALARSDCGRERAVCDFISGMTDPFATIAYNRLFDARIDFR